MVHRSLFALGFSFVVLAVAAGCGGSDSTDSQKSAGTGKSSKDGKSSSNDGEQDGTSDGDDGDDGKTDDAKPTEPSKKKNGAQCKESADCESDFCVFRSGGSLGMCTKTCSDDIDCDLGERCVQLGDAPQKACVPE